MFFSDPPIGDLCYRVYCSSQLANTGYKFASSKQYLKPLFYVTVMDIEMLQKEPFYLACTSERILLNKENLFDIFIDESNLKAVLNENQKNLLKVNSCDKKRFDQLVKKLESVDGENREETVFLKYFFQS